MSSLNMRAVAAPAYNAAGLKVRNITNEQKLLRMTMAHMLWENQFYVDGQESAKVMGELVSKVKPDFAAAVAERARNEFKLRHVPLMIMRELARKGNLRAEALNAVIQRPDEMGEFLSIYWKEGKTPISNQVKRGLAAAITKFNEYSLAKWDKNSAGVSIRDVLFLTHAKPVNDAQAELFKRIANKQLETPDTWETELSAGADKCATFTRLMNEKKLGALAFLRNLRNMVQSGVEDSLIRSYGASVNVDKVLPFRFLAAARIVPQFEDMLEQMMFKALEKHEKLPGKTVLVIDVSGSMFGAKVSAKSDLDRFDAAAALAVLCREICEQVEIFSFSYDAVRVAPRRGFALVEAIRNSQQHGGTSLGKSLRTVYTNVGKHDRCIVFTDEGSQDRVDAPKCKNAYVLNVASYENGINHQDWCTISGFSEAVLDYIQIFENLD